MEHEGPVPDVRVCVLGDELVAGTGDARALGWVGRVAARTPREVCRLTTFPLSVPREGTNGLVARWEEETSRRLVGVPAASARLVLGLGIADLREGMSTARSRLNLANVLDAAEARGWPCMVVGPPPVLAEGPDAAHVHTARSLSESFGDVCSRRRVPYVDTAAALATHEDWFADLAADEPGLPGQAGYGLLAWLVLNAGWVRWVGAA